MSGIMNHLDINYKHSIVKCTFHLYFAIKKPRNDIGSVQSGEEIGNIASLWLDRDIW